MIVNNLKPPYYAVIFSTITEDNLEGYFETAQKLKC